MSGMREWCHEYHRTIKTLSKYGVALDPRYGLASVELPNGDDLSVSTAKGRILLAMLEQYKGENGRNDELTEFVLAAISEIEEGCKHVATNSHEYGAFLEYADQIIGWFAGGEWNREPLPQFG